jgi:hypothetical protein
MQFSICELLRLEAGSGGQGQFGNPEKGNVRRWKPLPSNGSEDVTVDTSVCVIVNVKCSHALYQSVRVQ